MRKLPRILGLPLAFGLVLALVAPAGAVTPDKLLPASADAVVHADIKGLLDSGVIKKYALDQVKMLLKSNAQANFILGQVNFDPLKDLAAVSVAVTMTKNIQEPEAFVVGRGNFDVEKFHNVLAGVAKTMADKLAVSEYSGVKVYEGKEGRDSFFAAILDKNTVIASNKKDAVHAGIDRSKGKGPAGATKKELAAALDAVDAGQTFYMAVGIGGQLKEMIKMAPGAGAQAAMLDKLQGMSIAATVKDNVVADISVVATDADTAKAIAQIVDQAKLFAGAAIAGNLPPDLAGVVQAIIGGTKVSATGTSVKIKAEVSAEQIEKIVKFAKDQDKP